MPPASLHVQDDPGLRPWQFFLLGGMLSATALVVVATGRPLPVVLTLSVTVTAVGFVGLGVYRMLLPLVSASALPQVPVIGGRTRAGLEREKTLAVRAIKDLEFDHAMGKVGHADFEAMSSRLRTRAIRIMQRLEAGASYRGRIEDELRRRAGASATAAAAQPTTGRPVCLACGTGQDADARFCKQCGTAVGAGA